MSGGTDTDIDAATLTQKMFALFALMNIDIICVGDTKKLRYLV